MAEILEKETFLPPFESVTFNKLRIIISKPETKYPDFSFAEFGISFKGEVKIDPNFCVAFLEIKP